VARLNRDASLHLKAGADKDDGGVYSPWPMAFQDIVRAGTVPFTIVVVARLGWAGTSARGHP